MREWPVASRTTRASTLSGGAPPEGVEVEAPLPLPLLLLLLLLLPLLPPPFPFPLPRRLLLRLSVECELPCSTPSALASTNATPLSMHRSNSRRFSFARSTLP